MYPPRASAKIWREYPRIVLSVFGALLMYIISMAALFKLRRSRPNAELSYRAPFFPYFPAFALVASVVCMASMIYDNRLVALVFGLLLITGFAYFRLTASAREQFLKDTAPAASAELPAEAE